MKSRIILHMLFIVASPSFANEATCGSHELKKISYSELTSKSPQQQKVLNAAIPNILSFNNPQGSGFALAKTDEDTALLLTASHVARMLIRAGKRQSEKIIGYPLANDDLPAGTDARINFAREGNLTKIAGERLYTPPLTFKANLPIQRAYSQILKPAGDFTLLKANIKDLGKPITSLKWQAPKEGQKVFVIGQGVISSGCIDQLYPDQTFDMDAPVDDGMSGGMIIDAETGNVVGVLTTAFTNNDGKDDGSGGVSIETILRKLRAEQDEPFMKEHLQKAKLIDQLTEQMAKPAVASPADRPPSLLTPPRPAPEAAR